MKGVARAWCMAKAHETGRGGLGWEAGTGERTEVNLAGAWGEGAQSWEQWVGGEAATHLGSVLIWRSQNMGRKQRQTEKRKQGWCLAFGWWCPGETGTSSLRLCHHLQRGTDSGLDVLEPGMG